VADIPVQEIAELLDAVSDKVPKLLRSIMDLVYTPEAGRQIGQSAGSFYKELVAAGIPADRALQLAEAYLAPLKMLNNLMANGQSVSTSKG
jgi:hypothetical protein